MAAEIMKLHSDQEAAGISIAETPSHGGDGEEYIDLRHFSRFASAAASGQCLKSPQSRSFHSQIRKSTPAGLLSTNLAAVSGDMGIAFTHPDGGGRSSPNAPYVPSRSSDVNDFGTRHPCNRGWSAPRDLRRARS
jgi:hypothetical protein